MDQSLTFTVLGARGSWPVSDSEMLVHGGRTTSFMIALGSAVTVLIDAGTGLAFVDDIDTTEPQTYHVFLTHFHLDHIQGLQFFKPLYREMNDFTFYGMPPADMALEEAVGGIYRAPWFPLPLHETPSTKRYVALDGTPIDIGPLHISTTPLRHPQGAQGYRIEGPQATIVVATDHEAGDAAIDAALGEFSRGADHLLHDAQYTPEEHDDLYRGWGHSTWVDATEMAARAQVGQLVLTSHDPSRTDAELTKIVELAEQKFPATIAAREGLQFEI